MLGIPPEEFAIDWNKVVFNMLTIKGIYGREMYETWYEMTVMLQSGLDISPVITHRFASGDRGGVRHGGGRRGGQGHPALEGLRRMYAVRDAAAGELDEIRAAGLFKPERVIELPAAGHRRGRRRRGPQLLRQQLPRPRGPPGADRGRAGRRWTAGATAWRRVRFICGTQEIHKELEAKLSSFLGTEDTILYASCFDANGGLFETLLGPEDAVISDALNHASIIDGIRLCKAQRYRYANSDMAELEAQLQGRGRARGAADRHRRRLLHGRLRRPARRDLRPGRAATTRWSWSTTRTPSASSARAAAARPSSTA